jgi:hypothetical protein
VPDHAAGVSGPPVASGGDHAHAACVSGPPVASGGDHAYAAAVCAPPAALAPGNSRLVRGDTTRVMHGSALEQQDRTWSQDGLLTPLHDSRGAVTACNSATVLAVAAVGRQMLTPASVNTADLQRSVGTSASKPFTLKAATSHVMVLRVSSRSPRLRVRAGRRVHYTT